MLDADLLKHPVIRECVDALVDGRGGLVVYEQGLGGRETLVAAAVRIAATTGKTLTIVDAELLREATAHLATQLDLAEHTFLSPAQAAIWPTGFDPDGVLAVHGDVLRNQDMVEPLRAAARAASLHGHLVVARHPYGSNSLDTYTAQFRQITTAGFIPAPAAADSNGPDTPGPVASRVQSPSWQAQQIWEPTWIPHETDLPAETLAQEWIAAGESLTPTPTGLSEEVRDRGRSYQAAWRQLRRTQPDAPDSGPVSSPPDSDGIFWVPQEQSAGSPDIWADLEAKRQFLTARAAARTRSAPDPQPGTPPQQNQAYQDLDDSPAPSATQRMTKLDSDEQPETDREGSAQRRQRATELPTQAEPASSAGDEPAISYEEFSAWAENPDAQQAVQQRIAEVQADTLQRLEQAAAALATPLHDRPDQSRANPPGGNDPVQRAAREAHTPTAPPSPGPRP
ncbi:hypothetical protein [Streptomyces sp. NPDC018693]|uniref:hypothetical protein n=1 Tax=unclassified Streptomyces TaxID=2593676 RepID=UPI0037AEE191